MSFDEPRGVPVRPVRGVSGVRLTRRALLFILPVLALLATAVRFPAAVAQAPQPPLTGLLVLSSATADDLEAMPDGGIVVRFTIENRSGAAIGAATVRAVLPVGTAVRDSWQGAPGRGAGTAEGGAIAWGEIAVSDGAMTPEFAVRLVPAAGADGAQIFRFATIEASLTGPEIDPARVVAPPLKLNGLWGERGLRRTMLPTGLTVFTDEMPDSLTVAIRVAVRAGSRDETESTRGGSHWLEHAFFLGTPRRAGNEEVFNAIRNVGGILNASTAHELTNYYNTVPAEYFDLALDVVADQLLNSNFPRDRFERERRVVAEELRIYVDSPVAAAWDLFYEQIFTVSPLRQGPGGTIESVSTIPIETILAYRDERYRTGNMAVAVAGRLRHDEAVAKIAAAFAPLTRGPRAERPRIPEPVRTAPRRLEVGRGRDVAEIRMGWPVAGDDSDDSAALLILEAILGEVGLRLQRAIGEADVAAVDYFPYYDVFSDAGVFAVAGLSDADAADEFVAAVTSEIERMRSGRVAEREVQEAIRALIGRRALDGETSLGQTGVADIEVSGQLDSFLEYAARYSAVTAADVQRVARTYLDPRTVTLVVVRP